MSRHEREGPILKKKQDAKRYEYPIRANDEGIDATVDPDNGHIFSGMMKRTALETGGTFAPIDYRDED